MYQTNCLLAPPVFYILDIILISWIQPRFFFYYYFQVIKAGCYSSGCPTHNAVNHEIFIFNLIIYLTNLSLSFQILCCPIDGWTRDDADCTTLNGPTKNELMVSDALDRVLGSTCAGNSANSCNGYNGIVIIHLNFIK